MQTIALSQVFSYIYVLDRPAIRLYHKTLGFFTLYVTFLARHCMANAWNRCLQQTGTAKYQYIEEAAS